MKSWSLGRKSGEKSKKKAANSAPRPQSMILSSPCNTATSTGLATSSIQYSPSPSNSPRQSFSNSSPASKHLSTAQLKDNAARRENGAPTSATTGSLKKAAMPGKNSSSRERTTSLPSLIKSPSTMSPAPSVPLLSPTAAVVRGSTSDSLTHVHQSLHTCDLPDLGLLLSDKASIRSSESLIFPLSPSPQNGKRLEVGNINDDTANKKADNDKNEENEHDIKRQEHNVRFVEPNKMTVEKTEKANTGRAVDSLRKFRGVEGFGMVDRKRLDNVDSLSVKETTTPEDVKPQESESDKEQDKYPFAIRKKKAGSKRKSTTTLVTKQKPRPVEARYHLALVTHNAHLLPLGRQETKGGLSTRLLLAVPIPSLLGCDRAAGWTIERVSRITSCLIYAFGS